jgi:hypothetical protein
VQLGKRAATDYACNTLAIVFVEILCVPLIEEAFVGAEVKIGEMYLARVVAKADATDAEAMQVGVISAHGDLQGMMEISDGAVAAHQEPAPDQGRDLTQPHVELINFNDGGRLAHGIASLPRLTAMASQHNCRQPPLCDGLQVDWRLEDQIRQALYPLELATGAVITVHAYSREAWDSPLYRAMPFTQHVERDGIVL